MKVMKFGGTSVGSAESILNLKKIVEACKLLHEQELYLLWKTINEDNGFFTIEPLR